MKHWRQWINVILGIVLLSLAGAVLAQGTAITRITQVDASAFPEMKVQLFAAAADGTPVTDFSSLQLTENGTAITNLQTSPVNTGIEVVFVIDANTSINTRDNSQLSRREQVRDALVAFAQNLMNKSQLDRIHVIVPNEAYDGAKFLLENAVFPNELINAINFYVPDAPKATPLQAMLDAATSKLAASDGQRFRAIVLFTDGGELDNQLDFAALLSSAQQNGIAYYAYLLGSRADNNEIENVNNLTQPTGGSYLHMPTAADATPLLTTIATFGQQTEVRYRSQIARSGEHMLQVSLNGQTANELVNLTVEPPTVQILLDNSQTIVRVAEAADTPLTEMEPLSQPVPAQVIWPDNHPRSLAAATLLVNGKEQITLESPTLDANGLLQFAWDISELDAGEYNLGVELVDELNLTSESDALALSITIEKPAVAAASTTVPETTTAPDTTNEATANGETEGTSGSDFLAENKTVLAVGGGLLAFGAFIFMGVLVLVFIGRRRRAEPQPVPVPPPAPVTGMAVDNADATQIIMPAFIASKATLQPLEHAAEYTSPIAITTNEVKIGRDRTHAQIVFNDKSVSRLHATIRQEKGQFLLIDEGSASGTYINFERVGLTPQVLRNNDEIHFGQVHVRFALAEKLTPAAQPGPDLEHTMAWNPAQPSPQASPPVDENVNTEYYMPQNQPGVPRQPQQPPQARPQPPQQQPQMRPQPPQQQPQMRPQPPQQQPQARPQPPQQQPPSRSSGNSDPDDVSTQPYMPHQPKR